MCSYLEITHVITPNSQVYNFKYQLQYWTYELNSEFDIRDLLDNEGIALFTIKWNQLMVWYPTHNNFGNHQ